MIYDLIVHCSLSIETVPDLCFERDDVAAVEVAVVTVLFADVGAVGDLLGVGFGLEAEMVGAGIGGTDQAGEVEEREVCGFVMPEMVRAVGRLERGPLSVPIRVGSAVPHPLSSAPCARMILAFMPNSFSASAAASRQVCKKLIFLSIIYRYLFVFQIDNDYIYIL